MNTRKSVRAAAIAAVWALALAGAALPAAAADWVHSGRYQYFSEGPLGGLRLAGFAVWERKAGGRNVTFPARQYTVNGERRSFSLLRPNDPAAQDRLRDLILAAYKEHEAALAAAV